MAEEDYRIGIMTGRIPPPVPKAFQSGYKKKEESYADRLLWEFNVGYFRQLGAIAAGWTMHQGGGSDPSVFLVHGTNGPAHQASDKASSKTSQPKGQSQVNWRDIVGHTEEPKKVLEDFGPYLQSLRKLGTELLANPSDNFRTKSPDKVIPHTQDDPSKEVVGETPNPIREEAIASSLTQQNGLNPIDKVADQKKITTHLPKDQPTNDEVKG